MDSKGLDVCNNLERDMACCVVAAGMEGRRLAITVWTVLPSLYMHGLRMAGRVLTSVWHAELRSDSRGQVARLPQARAWCAGNQHSMLQARGQT